MDAKHTTLKDQGYRFCVNQENKAQGNWFHPLEAPAGWTDATEMNDAEFDAFMSIAGA